MKYTFPLEDWLNVPLPRWKVHGRPLPKGMSACIVGFIVCKRKRK